MSANNTTIKPTQKSMVLEYSVKPRLGCSLVWGYSRTL